MSHLLVKLYSNGRVWFTTGGVFRRCILEGNAFEICVVTLAVIPRFDSPLCLVRGALCDITFLQQLLANQTIYMLVADGLVPTWQLFEVTNGFTVGTRMYMHADTHSDA